MRRAAYMIAVVLLLGLIGSLFAAWRPELLGPATLLGRVRKGFAPRVMTEAQYERWAREQFYKKFPDKKPLNWHVANRARRYYETKSMGKFVLHHNDCSDFVNCIVDDALGPGARFRRNSDQHIVICTPGVMKVFYWESGITVLPGDIVTVEHSPWYPPKEPSAIRHIGVVGPDGYVYDFVKLRSWSRARYGRHRFEWFIRHSPDPGEVIISRLRPEYRFGVAPLPWG